MQKKIGLIYRIMEELIPTQLKTLAKIISTLYKSKFTVLTSSGLSAITLTLKTFLKKNDEVLITENCYEPVFNFAQSELSKFGVKVSIFF